MEPFLPNHQREKTAILLIRFVLLLEIISAFSGLLQYNLLNSFQIGSEISEETINANDLREQIISIIYLIVYIISAITFIRWFRRAYYNLSLRAFRLSYSDGMAAGAWFIPFVNLFRPYRMMQELHEQTSTLLFTKNIHPEKRLQTTIVGWWWGLWIANGFVSQIAFRLSMGADNVETLMDSTILSIISNLFGIPLALITINMIKNYAAFEPLLYEIRDTETTPKLDEVNENEENSKNIIY